MLRVGDGVAGGVGVRVAITILFSHGGLGYAARTICSASREASRNAVLLRKSAVGEEKPTFHYRSEFDENLGGIAAFSKSQN